MRRNPDDADLLRRLTVEMDEDPRAMRGKVDHYVEFRVFDGKDYAAVATFRMMRKYAEAVDVQVTPKYRRMGVASWLYRWVENRTGLIVKHSKDQTTDGKAFAQGRRRNPGASDEQRLLDRFGTTDEPVQVGFVTTSGDSINFGDGNLDGGKAISHDEATRAIGSSIAKVCKAGAIRIRAYWTNMLVDCRKAPTEAQVEAVARLVRISIKRIDPEVIGGFTVEIWKHGSKKMSVIYPATPGRVRTVLETIR